MSSAAYDPSLPLPELCDVDDGNPDPPPDMSDGETVSSDSGGSDCDFYIESDANLLRLREAALLSARLRRQEALQPDQLEQHDADEDMDIVDSPSSIVVPDGDVEAALMEAEAERAAIPSSADLLEVEDEAVGESEDACLAGVKHFTDANISSELARLADLAEWVVVDECEDALDTKLDQQADVPNAGGIEEDEEEADAPTVGNSDAEVEEDEDEEELLALRELLISNLRANKASGKTVHSSIGNQIEKSNHEDVLMAENVLPNAEAELFKVTTEATESASTPNSTAENVPDSGATQYTSAAQTETNLQRLSSQHEKSCVIPKSIIKNYCNATSTTASSATANETKNTASLTTVANDLVMVANPSLQQALTSVASAPTLSLPSSTLTVPAELARTQSQRRRVIGLSSHELRNTGSANGPTRRFVICLGDSSDDSSSESSISDAPARSVRADPPPVTIVDDRARLQSLRHSVRAGASKLRAGLAANRQELQQRQAKLTDRLAELTEKRAAAIRLRLETRRAQELVAQLQKRSAAADAELRRLESIAAKEQRLLRAKQAAFRARESRVLAALNQSDLLRKVCPPTPSNAPALDPFIPLCPFGLHGSCRDPDCEYQHPSDWRLPENASRGRPVTTSALNPALAATAGSAIQIRRPNTTNNSSATGSSLGSVSVKDFCDACENYVTVSGAHLRDDPRCSTCLPTKSPEEAISVLHHFLCRLRARLTNSTDSRECIAAAEAFANASTGEFPNHVGLVLHSLELRRLTKRPVPVALLKTLLSRVPDCGIVRRALRLQPDFLGQRQLLEFAFALPELRSANSLDLLQLALAHCRLLYLDSSRVDMKVQQMVFPPGMSTAHMACLQLCRLYWMLKDAMPDLPNTSLRSEAALLAELPIFYELKPEKSVSENITIDCLHKALVDGGIMSPSSVKAEESASIKAEMLAASICGWLIGPEPACPFRHCLSLIVARCLACKFGTNLNGLSAVYRLLAVRRACLPALSDWLSTLTLNGTALSVKALTELLRDCGAASVNHWADLAHLTAHWALQNPLNVNETSPCKEDEVELILGMAISASFGDRLGLRADNRDAMLLRYQHLLGLLEGEEALKFSERPVRSLSAMDPEAQLCVVLNYAKLMKLRDISDTSLSLISVASRLASPRSGVCLLEHLATTSSLPESTNPVMIESLCRALRPLLQAPCSTAIAAAAAKFIDAIDWKLANQQSSTMVVAELTAIANRIPDSLPLMQSVCTALAACNRLHEACALCLDAARFHHPTNPAFWLDLALELVKTTHSGAIRPQLELLERGLQLLPLCRRLWLNALALANSAGLHRTVDRLKAGMSARLGSMADQPTDPEEVASAATSSSAAPSAIKSRAMATGKMD